MGRLTLLLLLVTSAFSVANADTLWKCEQPDERLMPAFLARDWEQRRARFVCANCEVQEDWAPMEKIGERVFFLKRSMVTSYVVMPLSSQVAEFVRIGANLNYLRTYVCHGVTRTD